MSSSITSLDGTHTATVKQATSQLDQILAKVCVCVCFVTFTCVLFIQHQQDVSDEAMFSENLKMSLGHKCSSLQEVGCNVA